MLARIVHAVIVALAEVIKRCSVCTRKIIQNLWRNLVIRTLGIAPIKSTVGGVLTFRTFGVRHYKDILAHFLRSK